MTLLSNRKRLHSRLAHVHVDDYLLKLLQSRVLTLLSASRSFTSTFRGYDEGPLRIALRSRDVIPTNYREDTSSNRLEGPPGSRGRFKCDPVTAKFNICGRATRLCLRGANEFAVAASSAQFPRYFGITYS